MFSGVCICSKSAFKLWSYFSHSQDSWVQESRGGNGSGTTHSYPYWSASKSFASCSHDLTLCWSRGLSSKGRNVSTRRYNSDSIKLEVKTIPTRPLWDPHASELTGRVRRHCTGWGGWSWLPMGNWTLLHNREEEEFVWNTGDCLGSQYYPAPWKTIIQFRQDQSFQECRFGSPHQAKNHD